MVILLLPPASETVIETTFSVENTNHHYRVIRLWEEDPELFLNENALLPLAPLTATTQPQTLLQRIVERVEQLEDETRSEISTYTQILAGLKYKKDLVRQLFRKGMMRESVIFQEILEEGKQEGERSLVLRLLTRQVGELPQDIKNRIASLSIEQLENLGEALLDFQGINDLTAWLSREI